MQRIYLLIWVGFREGVSSSPFNLKFIPLKLLKYLVKLKEVYSKYSYKGFVGVFFLQKAYLFILKGKIYVSLLKIKERVSLFFLKMSSFFSNGDRGKIIIKGEMGVRLKNISYILWKINNF